MCTAAKIAESHSIKERWEEIMKFQTDYPYTMFGYPIKDISNCKTTGGIVITFGDNSGITMYLPEGA